MASSHTPTPWELLPESVDPNGYHLVVGGAEKNYGLVATVTLRDDAALIVAAVNAYEANKARISELEAEVAALKAQGFTLKQATHCASCGQFKHTPLRRDEMGGYVCMTCIDNALDARAALRSQS